jgi:hypothetical protein
MGKRGLKINFKIKSPFNIRSKVKKPRINNLIPILLLIVITILGIGVLYYTDQLPKPNVTTPERDTNNIPRRSLIQEEWSQTTARRGMSRRR